VIVFLLLQAFLIQGSFMTSQADSSHPDFNEDSLPELRREPNPPVPFWFQQQLEPPPGIMSDKHSRITYAGSSLCFKFFKDSHYYSRRILPLGGAYTKFADPEMAPGEEEGNSTMWMPGIPNLSNRCPTQQKKSRKLQGLAQAPQITLDHDKWT